MIPQCLLISGLPGSGKSTMGQALVERSFVHLEVSDLVKRLYGVQRKGNATFLDYVQETFHRERTASLFSQTALTASKPARDGAKRVVITGFRSPIETQHFLHYVPHTRLVFLRCTFNLRQERKEAVDMATGLTLEQRSEVECGWGSAYIAQLADLTVDTSLPRQCCTSILLDLMEVPRHNR